jgi:hypothetical protein
MLKKALFFRCAAAGFFLLLAVASASPIFAQSPAQPAPAAPIQGTTTTVGGLTAADTITQLVRPVGAPHVGEALGLATVLNVATEPLGAISGGFVIKLDPSTGLQVRTATTFGPAFAERALTSGEGKVSIGASFMSSTLDRLGTSPVSGLQLLSPAAASPRDARSGITNLTLSAKSVVFAARIGITDKLDVGAAVPLVTVKVGGNSTLMNGIGDILLYATGSDVASGLGDIAGLVKYRFYSFGTGLPDPGGLAVMVTVRLPTGDRDNLRGLGITRGLVTFIASSGRGRLRPHGNLGFEWWSKGLAVISDNASTPSVTARHQALYVGGLEFEAAPKVTLLIDLLGAQIFGAGQLGFANHVITPPGPPGTTLAGALVALPEGISRISLVPGFKVNLIGKLVLSVNALVALHDNGLHARVTPVAGIDLTF